MIKLGFKLFGCCTVVFFFLAAGIFMAVSTVPPSYSVRSEIRENVYPPAREHLKDKFNFFMRETINGRDVGEFEISEIEANAYLYWAAEQYVPNGIQLVRDPYLFIDKETLTLRFDIPVSNFFELTGAYATGKQLDEALKMVNESETDRGTIALTFIFNVFWIDKESRPYFYFDRFYIGVLPISISVFLAEYQDQFNRMAEEGYYKMFTYSPVYIRKIEVQDKVVSLKTEIKVTDIVANRAKMEEFSDKNPELSRALDSRNCLYGCTPEERQKLREWMEKIDDRSANDITGREAMLFSSIKQTMQERKVSKIQDFHRGIHDGKFDANYWRQWQQRDPDRDWGFKNMPEPDYEEYDE